MSTFYFLLFYVYSIYTLFTLSHASLLSTPASKSTMHIYGPIPASVDAEFTILKSIKITTEAHISAELLKLDYISLNLFTLPLGDAIPISKSIENYDHNQLSWDLNLQMPPGNDGLLVDLQVFWQHIEHTDDLERGSTYTFVFETKPKEVVLKQLKSDKNNKNTTKNKTDALEYKYSQKINYIYLKYHDTDSQFDYRCQTFLFQDQSGKDVNTFYRFHTLLHDTTKWDTKHITLHFVGPLQYHMKPSTSKTNNLPSPTHQSITTTPLKTIQTSTCLLNSIEHEVVLDIDLGMLHIDLSADDHDDSIINHRSALSLSCPDIYVVQTYPSTPGFNYATEAISVISIYDSVELSPIHTIDNRAVKVKLYSHVNVPKRILGEGWVENHLVMATYGLEYEDGAEIEPSSSNTLVFEWSKVFFEKTIHSYALPFKTSTSSTQWTTHQVSSINSKQKSPLYSIEYNLLDIFNANKITLTNFIVQQYATIQNKEQSIDAVNVFQYKHMAHPIRESIKTHSHTHTQELSKDFSSPSPSSSLAKLSKPSPELISIGIVPQLTFYQAIAKDVDFNPGSEGFDYSMNSTLTSFNIIRYTFPRGAQIFSGDYSKCKLILQHGTSKTEYTIKGNTADQIHTNHSQLEFDLRTINEKPVVSIGDHLHITCDGDIEFRHKQPALSRDYITCQVMLETAQLEGIDEQLVEEYQDIIEEVNDEFQALTKGKNNGLARNNLPTSLPIIKKLSNSGLHAQTPLLQTKTSSPVFQTTIEFIPSQYSLNILIMLVAAFAFFFLLTLALFSTPILVFFGVFTSTDRTIINTAEEDYPTNSTYGSTSVTPKLAPKDTSSALHQSSSSFSINNISSTSIPENEQLLLNSHGKPIKSILKK